MCGIAGIWRFNNKAEPKDKIRVEEALKMMRLRGPDNSAISHHNNYTLGHVRLSIIDTSDNANQPFKIDENEGKELSKFPKDWNNLLHVFAVNRAKELLILDFIEKSDKEKLLADFKQYFK